VKLRFTDLEKTVRQVAEYSAGFMGHWLTAYIEEYALDRKLTEAELKRFVGKNVLTINREP
jgi:hypothetical protein